MVINMTTRTCWAAVRTTPSDWSISRTLLKILMRNCKGVHFVNRNHVLVIRILVQIHWLYSVMRSGASRIQSPSALLLLSGLLIMMLLLHQECGLILLGGQFSFQILVIITKLHQIIIIFSSISHSRTLLKRMTPVDRPLRFRVLLNKILMNPYHSSSKLQQSLIF